MKSGEAFYITSYCMPQLLFFLSFLFSLTSITLRFIISLLMPLQPPGREIKRTGKSSPLVFGHLHCIGFSLFPYLCTYFKNICVAALHQVNIPLLLLLLIENKRCFCFPLDLSAVGKVSCQRGLGMLIRLSILHWSH